LAKPTIETFATKNRNPKRSIIPYLHFGFKHLNSKHLVKGGIKTAKLQHPSLSYA
jgi:hypothetical protein